MANSELFVSKDIQLAKLNGVSFKIGGKCEIPEMFKVEKELVYSVDKITKFHCGAFSEEVTGIKENVENEHAPSGRSLFADDLIWGANLGNNEQRGNWGNHYAPVIIADGGDRGTFETAVGVDYAWFGIYGQKRGQTFRLKTIVSDIQLAKEKKLIDEVTAKNFLDAINEYIINGSTDHEDKYLKEELEKIKSLVDQPSPDIDSKFNEEKRGREKEKEELEGYWKSISDLNISAVGIMKLFENMHPQTVEFLILDKLKKRATNENNITILEKINKCKKLSSK